MKKLNVLTLAALCLLSSAAFAAKDYQVTGPIIELTDTKIVIQKGKEKWELARGANTKVTGELKVGSKVTAYYSMTATEVESKDTKEVKKDVKKK